MKTVLRIGQPIYLEAVNNNARNSNYAGKLIPAIITAVKNKYFYCQSTEVYLERTAFDFNLRQDKTDKNKVPCPDWRVWMNPQEKADSERRLLLAKEISKRCYSFTLDELEEVKIRFIDKS